jgi:outer membrane protein OmpA-like peptidoglycan-associated protein
MAKKMSVLGLLLLLAGMAWAQTKGVEHHAVSEVRGARASVNGPAYADVFCAGYITSQPPHIFGGVAGGWNSPHANLYGSDEYVYLKGTGFEVGKTYEIVREVKDPNHTVNYAGQKEAVEAAGKIFFEMGSVKVLDVRGPIAITQVQFACDGMMPGDQVVAMPDRTIPLYHGPMAFDRFALPNGKTTGRIILAHDFDTDLGARSKVYLSIGTDKGVKVGDYFRITRDYVAPHKDEVDRISFGTRDMIDDSQQNPQRLQVSELNLLPRRSLGELVITEVSPRSATGVITFALEEMFLGDLVEMIDVPPPAAADLGPAPMPPTIACTAAPATTRCGDNANINCDASSPDNRPLTFAWTSDRGSLSPRDNNATLATPRDGSGPITVNATVTDDRDLSASTAVMVNVECAPLQAAMVGEVMFKPNSAYVDNRAKAMLDGVALRLNQDRDAKAVIIGYSDAKEAKGLALRRAEAVKTYLTKNKGIDAGRISTRAGSGAGKKAEVWIIPAGATMP